MQSGVFITFEGGDGSGKSTLIRHVAQALRKQGVRSVVTREPGGSPVAERIRKVLITQTMDPWTELFLYEAARAEHLARTVRPALNQGTWVLCDRFTDSSLAYQAYARGLPWKEVKALNQSATRGLKPTLTVLLDVDPRVALGRATRKNRFEAEGLRFQQRVRQGFLKARRDDPKRWVVVRARSETPEKLAEKVMLALEGRLGRTKWRAK